MNAESHQYSPWLPLATCLAPMSPWCFACHLIGSATGLHLADLCGTRGHLVSLPKGPGGLEHNLCEHQEMAPNLCLVSWGCLPTGVAHLIIILNI